MSSWPFPAPQDCGGARHLKAGEEIPDIPLPSTRGGEISVSALSGISIVFVYPWTGRPGAPNPPGWDDIQGAHGSTPEAEGFRDVHAEFERRAVSIIGLSTQTTAYQREFADRLALPFQLLSDAGFTLQKALALPVFETGGDIYLKRLTLIVRDGVLVKTFFPVHPPDSHATEVLKSLRFIAV